VYAAFDGCMPPICFSVTADRMAVYFYERPFLHSTVKQTADDQIAFSNVVII
jgi:hypothetical protein